MLHYFSNNFVINTHPVSESGIFLRKKHSAWRLVQYRLRNLLVKRRDVKSAIVLSPSWKANFSGKWHLKPESMFHWLQFEEQWDKKKNNGLDMYRAFAGGPHTSRFFFPFSFGRICTVVYQADPAATTSGTFKSFHSGWPRECPREHPSYSTINTQLCLHVRAKRIHSTVSMGNTREITALVFPCNSFSRIAKNR